MKGGFSRKRKLGKALSGGLLSQLLGETGNTISDADRAMLQTMMGSAGAGAGAAAALGGSGNSISNADMARIQKLLGSMKGPQPKTDRQLMQFEDGGKVKKAKKYKGPLPKPKPTKVERLLNKRIKGEKGPYIPKIGDLNEMGPMIIDNKTGKQVKRLNKGGSTFPDLTGDGKVTKKDILKGRGVEGFEHGGEVRGMGKAYMGSSRKAKIR
jgi:hypothetical protein